MLKHLISICFYSLILLNQINSADAQIVYKGIKEFVEDESEMKAKGIQNYSLVEEVYRLNDYKYIWLHDTDLQKSLFLLLSSAANFGLEENDYQFSFIHSYKLNLYSLFYPTDSILADIRLTDASVHFLKEVKNGSVKPSFQYEGFHYEPVVSMIPELLLNYTKQGQFDSLVTSVEPKCIEYIQMKALLAIWDNKIRDINFEDAILTSAKVDTGNMELITRLKQLGFIKEHDPVTNKLLKEKLISAQKMFNLYNDGMLRSTTLNALNVPLKNRMKELKLALNYVKWLYDLKETGSAVLINIPSAELFVYDKGLLALKSKIIAGKPSTPTSTLTSVINEVILYPYWNVPHSIATKELLPRIKRSIAYLGKNNYQVLNKQGKIIDPYSISWKMLNASNFPYLIRQATGCDNSLGIIKFNFYSPFSIYLHDTPSKSLFLLNNRFFSHGCMRVEKPEELARWLLKKKNSTLEYLISQCLEDQEPETLKLDQPLPIIVMYSTAWYDEKGDTHFYNDVYHKMQDRSFVQNSLR